MSERLSHASAAAPQRPGPHGADPWARYRDNPARHLMGLARDLQARVHDELDRDPAFPNLRPSFGPFLAITPGEGRPLGEIATRLEISGQAASQLANGLEAAGYLERRPHPEDGRSRLVRPTARGATLLDASETLIRRAEMEYTALVGPHAMAGFTTTLAALAEDLGLARPHADRRTRAGLASLPLLSNWIQRALMDATTARGHAGLRLSYGQVLPLIGPEGGRVAAIARVQGVSRQAISTTTRDLERLGYLRRDADPGDRRGVVLRLTARGERLIADSIASLDDLDAELEERLGAARARRMCGVARALYDALRLEREIFDRDEAPDPASPAARRDIERLAARLRRRLGPHDTQRLATALAAAPTTNGS